MSWVFQAYMWQWQNLFLCLASPIVVFFAFRRVPIGARLFASVIGFFFGFLGVLGTFEHLRSSGAIYFILSIVCLILLAAIHLKYEHTKVH